MRLALLLVGLLAAPAALADDAPVVQGEVGVLQDWIGGRFRDVVKTSREVEIVRGGAEVPAGPGLPVVRGDAIRTGRGRVVVNLAGGGTLLVGERSQLRFEPDGSWTHRLGRLDAVVTGAVRVTVTGVSVEAEDAEFRIDRTIAGDGSLTVLSGRVSLIVGGIGRTMPPGTRTTFTQAAAVETVTMDAEAVEDLAAERDITPPADDGPSAREAVRGHLRIAGGVSRLHGDDFGRADVSVRIRLGGPVFFAAGGGFNFRAVDDPEIDAAFVVPFHAGVRVVGELGRGFLLFGGVDFTGYVGEWCAGLGCVDEPVLEPGVRAMLGGGLELGARVGMDLTVGAGVVRREIPARFNPPEPVVPDLQLHFGVGVFFLL